MVSAVIKNRVYTFRQKALQCVMLNVVLTVVHTKVLQGAFDGEREHLLAGCVGTRSVLTSTLWKEWLEHALCMLDHVTVVYLPKGCAKYSARYDVRGAAASDTYNGGIHMQTIRPLSHVLEDQFLRGYVVKPPADLMRVDAGFGVRNVDVSCCTQQSFLSETLSVFLQRDSALLSDKGKECAYDLDSALSADVLKHIVPKWKRLRWTIVEKECFLASIEQKTQESVSVFFILGGVGILRGRTESKLMFWGKERRVPPGSLQSYKIHRAWKDLQRKYPFS